MPYPYHYRSDSQPGKFPNRLPSLRKAFVSLVGWLLLIFLVSGCQAQPAPATAQWQAGDVRSFDPLEQNQPDPEFDITVVYAKTSSKSLDFRLELLAVPDHQPGDLFLLLDLLPGGRSPQLTLPAGENQLLSETDLVVRFPSTGRSQAWLTATATDLAHPRLRITRNPTLAFISLHLDVSALDYLPARARGQFAITRPGGDQVQDASPVFQLHGTAPPPPAQVFFAFWDTFWAYTPAQALRSWDGAHSGPFGERHGLGPLLASFRRAQAPLLLADLLEPAALSGLDYLAVLPRLQRQAQQFPLSLGSSLPPIPAGLPDPHQFAADLLTENHRTAVATGLSGCRCVYLQNPGDLWYIPSYPGMLFTHRTEPNSAHPYLQVARWRQQLVVLLPEEAPVLLDRRGLNQACRTALLQSALAAAALPDRVAILALGGSLPQSGWGDPGAAAAALEYIQARPWIKMLAQHDLRSLPPVQLPEMVSAEFSRTGRQASDPGWPSVTYPGEAWSASRTLLQPSIPGLPGWSEMQSAYHWVPELLQWAAEQRATAPPGIGCQLVLTGFDRPLCVLADQELLAVIDPFQPGLLYLGRKDTIANGYAQIVGPSTQLAVGLSDPSRWLPEAGASADPAAWPAGFFTNHPAQQFQFTGASLSITTPEIDQRYQLFPGRMEVHLECRNGPSCWLPAQQVPLVITPQQRFQPGWSRNYQVPSPRSGSLVVGWEGGARLRITSSAPIQVDTFLDSPAPSLVAENPDQDYPPGHFLPFPLSLVTLPEQQGSLSVFFEIDQP
jgi:hypothetical protein